MKCTICLPNTFREWNDNLFRVTNSSVIILESNEQSIFFLLDLFLSL